MDYLELGYLGLFVICFLSATIIPLASEGVLLIFLASGFNPYYCLIVASSGNTLGGLTNYWIGMLGNPEKLMKRLKKPKTFERIKRMVKKYGYWAALFSWLPFIGDPLSIVLGFFRTPFWPVLILMTIGKTIRYWFIIFLWEF